LIFFTTFLVKGFASFCSTDAMGLAKIATVVAIAAVNATDTVGPASGT
tara:strand:+ start:582 stop:725 length:144 start_codon:yes stop_codon:yes gene_type:complete